VFEYVPNGNLRDFVLIHSRFPDPQCPRLFMQLFIFLDYPHTVHRVTHVRLMCETVLLDRYNTVKVVVFHISQSLGPGSPPFPVRDIQCLGVILYVTLTGSMPFERNECQPSAWPFGSGSSIEADADQVRRISGSRMPNANRSSQGFDQEILRILSRRARLRRGNSCVTRVFAQTQWSRGADDRFLTSRECSFGDDHHSRRWQAVHPEHAGNHQQHVTGVIVTMGSGDSLSGHGNDGGL
jgi:serine/threonine protein kinase